MTRAKENKRNKELGRLINMKFPKECVNFVDKYIIDILERSAQSGDLKQMMREAYILGMLHGANYGGEILKRNNHE